MPWQMTDPRHVRRPCCGALLPVWRLWPGSARFRHQPGCVLARPTSHDLTRLRAASEAGLIPRRQMTPTEESA